MGIFLALAAGDLAVTSMSVLAASDPSQAQTSGTTVAIIGAIAVVLVAAIGVAGNYISNRRTAPSPPGADPHDVGVHDRVTVIEANVSDMRKDIAKLADRDDAIDARVLPLREVMDAKLADVYRRLDKLEGRRR